MKILTFNVQHFRNFITREIDILSIYNIIKDLDLDIICLNEVFDKSDEEKYNKCAEKLALMLGYNYYFSKAIEISKGCYGNAILSKNKLTSFKILKIEDPLVKDEDVYYESRVLTVSKYDDLTILSTHIGLAQKEKQNAIKLILEQIKDLNRYVILGDFNMTNDDEILKPLLLITNDSIKDPLDYTFPSDKPDRRIDYILTSKDINVVNAKVIKQIASDHYPVYIEII